MMEQGSWRLFLEAAELGSLSKVALARGTSQPHVSRQISELEERCGGRLFLRTGRGVTLTALGLHIAPQIRAWLDQTEQLENDILSSATQPLGRVRLGLLPSLAHPFASALLQRLNTHYPRIRLQVREGQGAQLENWLDDGSLDLALVLRHGLVDTRDALALAETQTYLVSRPDDPLTAQPSMAYKRLHELPLVTFCRPSRWRDLLEQTAREQGIEFNVVQEADSLTLQKTIVASGRAYALLGMYAIKSDLQSGQLRASRIEQPQLVRHIGISLARTGQLSPAARAVMAEARVLAAETVDDVAKI